MKRGVLAGLTAMATLVVTDVVRAGPDSPPGPAPATAPAATPAPAAPAAATAAPAATPIPTLIPAPAPTATAPPTAPPLPAPLGTTITFPYEQQRLLLPHNGNGGLAYLPRGVTAGAKLPVVVFLHGMNAYGTMHMGFAAPFADLRTVVDDLVASGRIPPVVLAAPTHTRGAYAARRMWPDFDVRQFLSATETALAGAARLDLSQLVVVAHSGGACNPAGGIFAKGVRAASPLAVVAIDTCLYEDVVPQLAALAEEVHVGFYWQRAWPRPVDALVEACPSCSVQELVDLPPKPSPHLTILPVAFERGLQDVLGAAPGPVVAHAPRP